MTDHPTIRPTFSTIESLSGLNEWTWTHKKETNKQKQTNRDALHLKTEKAKFFCTMQSNTIIFLSFEVERKCFICDLRRDRVLVRNVKVSCDVQWSQALRGNQTIYRYCSAALGAVKYFSPTEF